MINSAQRSRDAAVHTPLGPRFRRPLSVADVLDEGIRVFRQHLVPLASISAVALLPAAIVNIPLFALLDRLSTVSLERATSPTGVIAEIASLSGLVLGGVLLAIICQVLWVAAILVATDGALRSRMLRPVAAYRAVLSRALPLTLGVVLFGAICSVIGFLAVLLSAFTLYIVGAVIALLGLVFWWLRPSTRRPWLKWLIVLCAPMGVFAYLAVRCALFAAAIILERRGPVDALLRSADLTSGRWFRVATVLALAPVLIGVVVSMVEWTVSLAISLFSLLAGAAPSPLLSIGLGINLALGTLMQIFFGSAPIVIYTLLFHDLRNRREGTDLLERLHELDPLTRPGAAHG